MRRLRLLGRRPRPGGGRSHVLALALEVPRVPAVEADAGRGETESGKITRSFDAGNFLSLTQNFQLLTFLGGVAEEAQEAEGALVAVPDAAECAGQHHRAEGTR